MNQPDACAPDQFYTQVKGLGAQAASDQADFVANVLDRVGAPEKSDAAVAVLTAALEHPLLNRVPNHVQYALLRLMTEAELFDWLFDLTGDLASAFIQHSVTHGSIEVRQHD